MRRLSENTRHTVVRMLELEAGDAWLVQMAGPDLGRMHALAQTELTIGREAGCGVVLDIETVSRAHARVRREGERTWVRDLGSTNGTYVNGVEVRDEMELGRGDLLQVGRAVLKFIAGSRAEEQYHETIYTMCTVDSLTRAYSRRYLMECLEREMSRAQRTGRALSVAMLDVDHFKRINDTHGHMAGDIVLRDVAARVARCLRREDLLARYGGEEFALLLPELEGNQAVQLAEKVRALVASEPFAFDGRTIPVTVSLGVAQLPAGPVGAARFLELADTQLYRAKQTGRNRVASCSTDDPLYGVALDSEAEQGVVP